MRWMKEHFPFTDPSIELEVRYNDEWLEILGAGVLRDTIVQRANVDIHKEVSWAFGLGLERWAMKLFDI
jgi:phenylalanyl-tRNA synthetase alpha chain